MDLMCEDYQKAKESRERQAAEKESRPYYWWEYLDPFEKKASQPPVSNPNGLARTKAELKKRLGKE